MSVNPVQYNQDGTYNIHHMEGDHYGSIPISEITYIKNIDGSDSYAGLNIKCPECGAVSSHPIGGGSSPPEVQEMHTWVIVDRGCPCGQVKTGANVSIAKAHAKKHCENQDFRGRWKLDGVTISPTPVQQ